MDIKNCKGIKKMRIQRYMTQEEFAKKVGVRQPSVSMWENGESKPSHKKLKKIASVLKVSINEVYDAFYGEEE